MQKTFYSILFSICCVGTVLGQNSGAIQTSDARKGDVLSLQKAVDVAIQNNISIKQSRLQVQGNSLQLQQSRWNRYPNLNGSIAQGLNSGRSVNQRTNEFIEQAVSFNAPSLSAGVTVYNGGILKNTIKQNEQILKASELDVLATQDQVSLNVVLSYLQILNNEDLLTISKNQVEQTKLQLARTEKLVNAGSLPQTNILDLKAQQANDETQVVNNQNTVDAARLQLKQLMNSTEWNEFQVDRVSVNAPSSGSYGATADEIYNIAVGTQANIKANDMRIQSANTGIEIAKAGLNPTISVGGSVNSNFTSAYKSFMQSGTTDVNLGTVQFNGQAIPLVVTQPNFVQGGTVGYFTQLNQNLSKGLSVSMRIPIFNQYQARTRIQQANLQKVNADLTAQQAKQTLRQSIETAYNNMTAAAKRYSATQTQVEALELAFKASESRYNVGALNFVDYNLARTNLERAKNNLIQAKYDYVFRTKILDYYQNKPLSF